MKRTQKMQLHEVWELAERREQAAMRAVFALNRALGELEQHNYGSANDWIEKALGRLPYDTGEAGIVWPAAEDH